MQSNLDPDLIEYQILSAKAAGIDGFFIEWGFMPHENDNLLKAMQPIAAKYGFEIGVNWCDGWLYYDWITKIYPDIKTRADKTKYMEKCFKYLADNVFTGKPLLSSTDVQSSIIRRWCYSRGVHTGAECQQGFCGEDKSCDVAQMGRLG